MRWLYYIIPIGAHLLFFQNFRNLLRVSLRWRLLFIVQRRLQQKLYTFHPEWGIIMLRSDD